MEKNIADVQALAAQKGKRVFEVGYRELTARGLTDWRSTFWIVNHPSYRRDLWTEGNEPEGVDDLRQHIGGSPDDEFDSLQEVYDDLNTLPVQTGALEPEPMT